MGEADFCERCLDRFDFFRLDLADELQCEVHAFDSRPSHVATYWTKPRNKRPKRRANLFAHVILTEEPQPVSPARSAAAALRKGNTAPPGRPPSARPASGCGRARRD